MTSIIHFTPISGVDNRTVPCYILQIDEFRFLLDCGCDEECNIEYIDRLRPFIGLIDAVLLSHPDTNHLGALPYLVGKCGLSCEVYATIPVYQMGQMFAYDLFQSRRNYEEFDLFTLDDVDMAFEKVVQVKYNQTIFLKGKGQGMTITPLPAGHMLGGTIWRIVKDGGEDIIYATDLNHKNEHHLNGCVLDKITRPSLLITDCINVDYVPERRRQRDQMLFGKVKETLRGGGNVLLSVDTAGRVLELAHMLDQLWRSEKTLQQFSLVLLNNFTYNVIEFAKSMVEWMSDKLMRSFEGQRNNPFSFRYLQLCHNLAELNRISEPYVVLASQPDLECGYSRELFFTLATDPNSTIILTQRSSPNSLADVLRNIENAESNKIKVEKKTRVPLTGKELEDYLEAKREEALEKERQEKALKESNADKNEEDEDDSEESDGDFFDENDLDEAKGSQIKKPETEASYPNNIKHDLMMSSRHDGRSKGGGFFKNAKKLYPMFPCVEKKMKWDEYGEIINSEEYSIFDMSRVNLTEDKENIDEFANGEINAGKEVELLDKTNKTPTKCLQAIQEVEVECKVVFIDFEGRSDGDSLKRIIAMIRPRRLILVRGSEEKIKSFASYCISNEIVTSERLFSPKVLDIVDATTERHIYQVKLRDALVSSLKFSNAKDGAQLAWVEAEILLTNAESLMPQTEDKAGQKEDITDAGRDKLENVSDEAVGQRSGRELMPTLQQLPLSRLPPHDTIFVNELRLSDFKQILMKNGVQAEFSGGVLLCNGQVEVKRTEQGHIHMEGTVSDDYFKVRQLLYEQYAIL